MEQNASVVRKEEKSIARVRLRTKTNKGANRG
jgi:hypothetical protein